MSEQREPRELAYDTEQIPGSILVDEATKAVYRWEGNIWREDVRYTPEAVEATLCSLRTAEFAAMMNALGQSIPEMRPA